MSDEPRKAGSLPPLQAAWRARAGRLLRRLQTSLPPASAVQAPRSSFVPAFPAGVRLQVTRPPLPITSLVLLLLLLLPALQLLRMPRPRAVGLEQLLGEASLLQSFPPTPDRPVPALWRERLGAQAESLWRRQRGPWWQFWGDHTDAAPLLAFSAASLARGPSTALPPNGLRIGDLVVVAADPLSRQLLQDRLLPQQRLSRGLNRRCLERLRQDQAVLWSSTGMGVVTGPVAPLLQRLGRGCLSFALADGGLIWQGEAGDGEGLLAALPASPQGMAQALPPLPQDRLLELEGGSTDLLLAGLLSRPLIRDPLSQRYGLDAGRLALLRRTPFRLVLRPQPQGPFQASLELQLPVGPRRRSWETLLQQLSSALVQQGLTPVSNVRVGSRDPDSMAAAAPSATGGEPQRLPSPSPQMRPRGLSDGGASWKRADGVIVGGWRWLDQSGGEAQLLLFLGPAPAEPLLPIPRAGRGALPAAGVLRLRSRPQALLGLGLLPPAVPELVRRSDQLWMVAEPLAGEDPATPFSLLSGGLRVPR